MVSLKYFPDQFYVSFRGRCFLESISWTSYILHFGVDGFLKAVPANTCLPYYMVSGGVERSAGIIFLKFDDKFHQSAAATAWSTSLPAGLRLTLGTYTHHRFALHRWPRHLSRLKRYFHYSADDDESISRTRNIFHFGVDGFTKAFLGPVQYFISG